MAIFNNLVANARYAGKESGKFTGKDGSEIAWVRVGFFDEEEDIIVTRYFKVDDAVKPLLDKLVKQQIYQITCEMVTFGKEVSLKIIDIKEIKQK